jgi:hypothetical protein
MSATNDVDPRTAKSCGPDAPTLASSSRKTLPRATVANKPGHRGERDISVKTIARGMPGVSGVTVVTTLVCSFHFACEAAGASRARHSLRPLFSESGMLLAKLGRITPRDREAVRLPSLREAKRRSNPYLLCRAMDCFASLAMTRLGCLKLRLVCPQTHSSCPDLIRASIIFAISSSKKMDHRA